MSNKNIPVCYGSKVFTSYLLYKVDYYTSFEEAVLQANKYRNLARADKYSVIQIGNSGDNLMVMEYDNKIVKWTITSAAVWGKEKIESVYIDQQKAQFKTLKEVCGMPSGSIGSHGNTYGILAEEENTGKYFVADTRHMSWLVTGRGEGGSTILRNPYVTPTKQAIDYLHPAESGWTTVQVGPTLKIPSFETEATGADSIREGIDQEILKKMKHVALGKAWDQAVIAEDAAIIDDLKCQMEAKIPQLLDQATHCPKCEADIHISPRVVSCTKCSWFRVPLQVTNLFEKKENK